MRQRSTATAVALAISLAVGHAGPALADHPEPPWPQHRRLYLMGADTQYLYWSADPNDPELPLERVLQRCGDTEYWRNLVPQRPCSAGALGSGQRTWDAFFLPGSLLGGEASWDANRPLRFHIELEVDAIPAGHSVAIAYQERGPMISSAPGTEVAPGVWEGTMKVPGSLEPGDVALFGVRVVTEASRVFSEIALNGRSWIELPGPVAMKPVTDLVADDTYRAAPSVFASATRTMRFNDGDWQSWSFAGDSAQARDFAIELPRDATAAVGWVEAYDAPVVQRAVRGLEAEPRHFLDAVTLSLLRGGEVIDHGPRAAFGQGIASFASTALEPGSLTLRVEGTNVTGEPLRYKAHLVAIYGPRTLASMRWTSLGETSNKALITECPGAYQPVPVTPEVRTVRVGLSWDTEAVTNAGWTLRFEIPDAAFPCGELGVGNWVRFTRLADGLHFMGATPVSNGVMVSAYDTVFTYEARYTYSPPPAAAHRL